jgi:ribosome-associated protein
MKTFRLTQTEFIELCGLLKLVGFCQTGGEAKNVIANGEVLVNGQVETRKRCKIIAEQVVTYNKQTVKVLPRE